MTIPLFNYDLLRQSLYRKMYLTRSAENAIKKYYHEDEMKTPMHMSAGGEAISAGVCQALTNEDQVFGTYRSHALYLSKTGDVEGFFTELYGKDGGIAQGKAGSMHLSLPLKGHMLSSAIVASSIPVAVGNAYANKFLNNKKLTVVFFGDGAIDEGNFWESINMACLWELPILFVCEYNGLAVHTTDKIRHGYENINDIISKFNCVQVESDSTDVEGIYYLTEDTIRKMNLWGNRPGFIKLKYYRYLEYVGISEDFKDGYREKEEFDRWYEKDPINSFRDKVFKVEEIEQEIDALVERSVMNAKNMKLAPIEVAYKDLYHG